MSAEQPMKEVQQVVAEAERLLRELRWGTLKGGYGRGQLVRILFAPSRAEDGEHYDVPITLQPLIVRASVLDGISIILRRPDRHGYTWFGRLNQRGQVLFRNLEPGVYQTQMMPLAASRDSRTAAHGAMAPLTPLKL